MTTKKKVCIIGGGAAGLVSAKTAIHYGLEVEILEQTSEIGGTWVYSDDIGCHTSMYKVMKTNLPKQAMLFEDTPFDDNLPSFMSHQNVLEYLQKFASDHNLPIRLQTTVTNVERVENIWKVEFIEKNCEKSHAFYDAVLVCNGHFFEPFNIFETSLFNGEIIHSHDYRRADKYKSKNVVIIGAGPSGIDIALQVAEHARKTILIGKKAKYDLPDEMTIQQIPYHVKSIGNNYIIIDDDNETIIETDAIIICTGYIFKFPFLSEKICEVKHDGMMVSPLWNHLSHVHYPDSLFFIGLPLATITFPLFEVQSKYACSIISGISLPPSQDQLFNFESKRLSEIENPCQYHCLIEEQWNMLDELAKMGKFEKWKYLDNIQKLYKYVIAERKKNVIGYKNLEIKDK